MNSIIANIKRENNQGVDQEETNYYENVFSKLQINGISFINIFGVLHSHLLIIL
jgi:hypothetical protein